MAIQITNLCAWQRSSGDEPPIAPDVYKRVMAQLLANLPFA